MNEEKYLVNWKNPGISLEDVAAQLPPGPKWKDILEAAQPHDWETVAEDMRQVSQKFGGILFEVEITDPNTGDRWVQYHRDGQHYQEPELRCMPEFDETKLG